MANPAKTVDQNLLPVQAYFDVYGNFQTFIGQGQPFLATISPIQSGLTITNSTLDSSPIGSTSPSTGVFTNVSATTGQISTTPTNATDIANKFYVDTVAQGLGPKAACAVATTTNITLSGLQTIDGYTTLSGDRVLVKNQGSSQFNGIYIASTTGWNRAVDMDVWAEVPGAYTVILNGGQSDTGWVCTATQTGTINVTAMPWVQFSGINTYYAGTGLSLASNTFSITPVGTAGTYGSASAVPVFTTNASGQVTSVTNTSIAIANTQVSGLGTMSTQNASNVAITGGSITGTPISGSTVGGTTITASSQFSGPGTGLTGTASGLSIGGSAGSATTATTATNIAGGATNSIPYQSAASTTTFLAAGTGVLQSSGGLSYTTTPTLTGTNFSSIPNSALINSSLTIGTTNIALGATASTLTSVTMATPTISSYETYTASSAPSYTAGRLWYDSTVNSLAYYNDVTNNTLHIGEEIQLKVYNNTGSTINVGQPVYVTSTSSGFTYPNVALAIANSLTTGNVIGLANQAIPTGTAGYVTTIGLVQGVNTGSYTVGDTLYLSPYSAGFYQNTIPPTGYAIKLGTVAYVNSSNGAIYVNKSILSVQAGNIVGQVALANGGTNANLTAVAGGIVYSGASALAISAAGTTGQVLTSAGTGTPTWTTPVSNATVTDDTTTNGTRYPLFANQTSGSLTTEYTSSTKLQYNPSTGVFTSTQFSGSGAGLTSIPNSALTNSSITIGSTAISLGGTATTIAGLTSVTSTTFVGALTGNASSATTATTATNATNIAITDNTSSVSTYYPVLSVATTGNNPATTSSTKLSFVPSTGVLSANGVALTGNLGSVTSVAQSFTGGIISVSGSPITTSGTLALTVAGTSGGIPYFTSASAWASSALLAANALMVGGGAGVAPSTITTGTGVVTALGVNTGSAGAFVVNGEALGTPSSGTVTNLTGTASININGTVGATTPTTGAFTTISASGVITSTVATGTAPFTVSSTTAVANLSIGGNAATATTATSATTATNIAGGSANQIHYQTASSTTGFITAPTVASTYLQWTGSAFAWATVTSGVTSISGTTNQITASASTGAVTLSLPASVTTGQFIANQTTSGSSSQGAFAYGTLSYSDNNHILTMQASQNSYIQMEIQNTNTGAAASSDVIVGNNNTTSTTYYGDFGMNSSGWAGTAGTNSFGAPNIVYLTSTSADLAIGTTGSNSIRFVTNSGADNATVSSAGVWTFANTITGSISGNAGTATTATTATNATNVAVADASTNANYYPTFVAATGSNQPLKTASSTLKYNPSTGALSTGSTIYIAP